MRHLGEAGDRFLCGNPSGKPEWLHGTKRLVAYFSNLIMGYLNNQYQEGLLFLNFSPFLLVADSEGIAVAMLIPLCISEGRRK